MANYECLIAGINDGLNLNERRQYFLDFYANNKYADYKLKKNLNSEEKEAIKILFNNHLDLDERIDRALEHDPFCREAFFMYYALTDVLFLDQRFKTYYMGKDSYWDYNEHQKEAYLSFMYMYAHFLVELGNISKAIVVEKTIMHLNQNHYDIDRLAVLYAKLEDVNELTRLYEYNDLSIKAYLLFIICLLKKEEDLKAESILRELIDEYPICEYLDHIWDLNLEDEIQKNFYRVIEENYDEINSIPSFFDWAHEVKEKARNYEE